MTTSRASVNRSNTDLELVLEPENAARVRLEEAALTSAEALLEALQPWLEEIGAEVEVTSVAIVPIGGQDSVLVKIEWRREGESVPLLGSFLIEGEVAAAGAQATLDAINRKVSGTGSDLVVEL